MSELKPDSEKKEERLSDKEKVNTEKTNAEEPNAEEPNAEEPNAEELKAEELNAEKPNAEKPNVEKLNEEKPNTEEINEEPPAASEDEDFFLMIIKLMKPVGQPDWNAAINFAARKKKTAYRRLHSGGGSRCNWDWNRILRGRTAEFCQ